MKMRNYVSRENTIRFITEFRKEFSPRRKPNTKIGHRVREAGNCIWKSVAALMLRSVN